MSDPSRYSPCSYCGGRVGPRVVKKECRRRRRTLAIFEDVPAGVCDECGERYFKADVVFRLQRKMLELKAAIDRGESPTIPYEATASAASPPQAPPSTETQ